MSHTMKPMGIFQTKHMILKIIAFTEILMIGRIQKKTMVTTLGWRIVRIV